MDRRQCVTALLLLASFHASPQEPAAAQAALNMQEAVRHWVFDAMAPANTAARERLRGQVEAMAGREDLQPARRDPAPCTALPDDPLDLIAREAQKTSIVIIGESHSEPRDRQFVGQVLQVLRHQGFDVYAAETFTGEHLDLPYVSGGDGWYSNEPIFGRTVSTARRHGYRLVAYEQTSEQEKARAAAEPEESSINRREWNQARNLMDRIFTKAPDSRVVIHVGGQHVDERRPPGSRTTDQWMAERLKVATGIDPLTIKLTTCASPASRTVASRIQPGAATTDLSPVDLYIGRPKLTFRDGRPEWRQAAGDRLLEMPRAFVGLAEPIMVEARSGTGDEALPSVPVDRVLLLPGEDLPMLLPPGRYRLDAFTRRGRLPLDAVMVEIP